MQRTYINDTTGANAAVSEIVSLYQSGKVTSDIALDIETAPMLGLVGYPGSQVDEAGNQIKATKKTYLEYTQFLWRVSFNPDALRELGIFIPIRTTAGKEAVSLLDAKAAWALMLERVSECSAAQLEAARWTEKTLYDASGRLWSTIEGLDCDEANLDIYEAARTPGKGQKKAIAQEKKLRAQRDEAQLQADFLDRRGCEYLEHPLPLSLLTHVLKVAVEGRIYLNQSGQNRLDPVQPGLDPYTSTVFLVQFTLVDWKTQETLSYIFNTHKVDIKQLLPILKLKNATFTGANIKFDLKMLMVHAGFAPKQVFCTRIASRMLYLGRRMSHSLSAVAERFLGENVEKAVRSSFVGVRYEEPTAEQMEYAYNDTEILPRLIAAQRDMADKRGQSELLDTFSRLSWVTAHWEVTGYRVDTDKWMEIARETAKTRDEIAAELEKMLLGDEYAALFSETVPDKAETDLDLDDDDDEEKVADVRPVAVLRMSQTQVVSARLAKLLDMPVPSLAKTARDNLDREYRATRNRDGHPFFALYNKWSKLAKAASTYGKKFLWYIHPLTGKIHPGFVIAGTDTARYTSTAPNLLNIPAAKEEGDPDFRGAFLADEGKLLLGADFDSMEFRIAGDVSREPKIRAMVEANADAHSFTAAMSFHIRVNNAIKEPQLVDGVYMRGTTSIPIKVWEVPGAWASEQITEFAFSKAVSDVVVSVPKKITRGDSKSTSFLYLFGGGPFTLAVRTGLPQDFCEQLFEKFTATYPVMDAYLKRVMQTSVIDTVLYDEDGFRYAYCEGYMGIRRYVQLPEPPDQKRFLNNHTGMYIAQKEYQRQIKRCQRELVNLKMQGGNAVITAEALNYIVERGAALGVYPWLSVYDEVICTFPKKADPYTAKIVLEGAMLDAAERWMTYVPPGATAELAKVGTYWVKS
jgi:DNA polymerase I-like protein with 3'-5' exonuclease and polymerase domains